MDRCIFIIFVLVYYFLLISNCITELVNATILKNGQDRDNKFFNYTYELDTHTRITRCF